MVSENHTRARALRRKAARGRKAFTLVELLTVIFIIALLIGILIPALNAARNAAKKVSSAKTIESVKVGLEMFKNENGQDFPQTNGYPPSFAHPPLSSFNNFQFEAHKGEFPFREGNPVVYGAHWLRAMLMGVDNQGYIKRSAVPRQGGALVEPPFWYVPGYTPKPIERAQLYLSAEGTATRMTKDLPGRPPEALTTLFPDWAEMSDLPVIVDAFDQPILYYASNTAGKATNMVEDHRDITNTYGTGDQDKGPPFYFHEDNVGFTGDLANPGWDFSNTSGEHAIRKDGADHTAVHIIREGDEYHNTFAHYIVDRKIYSQLLSTRESSGTLDTKTPLRPVNADTFLLISPGVDGKYGTIDDVSNIPQFEQR